MSDKISIEIAYADGHSERVHKLLVEIGTTAQQAITQSNILNEFPEIDLNAYKIGVFSKLISLDKVLQAGDRVEIYRPLKVDPKQKRRIRAKKQKR